MGREIHEIKVEEFVTKYEFGKQPCEQERIPEELGVGEIIEVVYGEGEMAEFRDWDVLKINRDELPKLKYLYKLHEGDKRIAK